MIDYKFSINTNEYLPLRDVVFNTLRNAILSSKIVPGERLMENQLAKKLGVSRTPIREALRMLELENLVELVPRKGAQVLQMTEKDIKDVLEIRRSLEALAVELACQRMDAEQLEELKLVEREFLEIYEAKNYEKTAELDEKFHDLIFASTQNDKLIQVFNNLRIQLYRYRVAYLKLPDLVKVTAQQHDEIIRTIENRLVGEGAKAAMAHIKYQTEVILKNLKQGTLAK